MDCLNLEYTDLYLGQPEVGEEYGLLIGVANDTEQVLVVGPLLKEGDAFEQIYASLYTCDNDVLDVGQSCEISAGIYAKEEGDLVVDLVLSADNPECDEAVISITASVQPSRVDGSDVYQGGCVGCASGPAGGQGTGVLSLLCWVVWQRRVIREVSDRGGAP